MYTFESAYTDPETKLQWVSPNAFVSLNLNELHLSNGLDYLNIVNNSNARLATYQEVRQLFAYIGFFSPLLGPLFGTDSSGAIGDLHAVSDGYYDAGNGQFGQATGSFARFGDNLEQHPWIFTSPVQPIADVIGIWAVIKA